MSELKNNGGIILNEVIENECINCDEYFTIQGATFINCTFMNFDEKLFTKCTFQNCALNTINTLSLLIDKKNTIVSGQILDSIKIIELLKDVNINWIDTFNQSILKGYTKYPKNTQIISIQIDNDI